jgi:hypothetical protein
VIASPGLDNTPYNPPVVTGRMRDGTPIQREPAAGGGFTFTWRRPTPTGGVQRRRERPSLPSGRTHRTVGACRRARPRW